MYMENSIEIGTEIDPIFRLASAIETWPSILPHYRGVEILSQTPEGRVASMSAWRGNIPVRWQAIQVIDSSSRVVSFHHIHGFTKGMDVYWRFQPLEVGGNPVTRVVISHELRPRRPDLLFQALNEFVGRVFIDYIATKTLLRVKELVETESHAPA